MGTVVHLRGCAESTRSTRVESGEPEDVTPSGTMPDVFRKCADLIGSTIADRIRELGGTERDVRQIADSAAFTVFVWSAGGTLGR
jgi:hypothetical protein